MSIEEQMRSIVAAAAISLTMAGCVTADYGKRPAAWCGWQARQEVAQDPGPKFNRALAWKNYGVSAGGPCVGCVVVWKRGNGGRGHVGIITGKAEDDQWIVRSGNDGHELRERPRSVKGAVSFRKPLTSAALNLPTL
jgi:CHAP domain